MSESNYQGPIAEIEIGGKLFEFRRPELDEFEEYQEKITGKGRKGAAMRELAQVCLLPSRSLAELQDAFRAAPAASVRIQDALVKMAGGEAEVTVKKG